jgi:capsular exopolysaccharide synthesis family protein
MELQLYLDIFKRRALVIVIVTAITMLVVTAAGILIPPVYTARATIRVLLDVGVTDLILREDYNKRLLNTYTHILTSEPILREAIIRLLPQTSSLAVASLRENVEIEVVPDTELISVDVKNGDPALAQDLANMLATLLIEYAQDLYVGSSMSTQQVIEEQLAGLENQIESDRQQLATLSSDDASSANVEALKSKIEFEEDAYDRLLERYELARLNESLRANSISLIAPASLPTKPSNSLGLTDVGLGLLVGLFGGLGLALVMENLDTRIHSSHQMEHLTNLPVLGTVPKGILPLDKSRRSSQASDIRATEEAYRLASINLQVFREEHPIKTVLITSAIPKEGKSMVSANLAQMLAERGQTVFLVESDLRRPVVKEIFNIDSDLGLSSILSERTSLDDDVLSQVIHPAEQPSLFVIAGGSQVSNPTALFASPSMEELLDYLGTQGHITLLDAPPVLGVADVSVLAPKVDGVILIVRQALSNRQQVRDALKQLQATRARVLGLIFVQKSSREWDY